MCIDLLDAQHALQRYESMYPAFQVKIAVFNPKLIVPKNFRIMEKKVTYLAFVRILELEMFD